MTRFKTFFLAGLVLAVSLGSGCSSVGHYWFKSTALTYVPARSALEPRSAPDYSADPDFHGYYQTCWRSWPEDWDPCPHREGCCVCEDGPSFEAQSEGTELESTEQESTEQESAKIKDTKSAGEVSLQDFDRSVKLVLERLPKAEQVPEIKSAELEDIPTFKIEHVSIRLPSQAKTRNLESPISVEAVPQIFSELPAEATKLYLQKDSIERKQSRGAMLFTPPVPGDLEGGTLNSHQEEIDSPQAFSVSSDRAAPFAVVTTAQADQQEPCDNSNGIQ